MSRTLVLGLGNTLLKDDGLGVKVIEQLSHHSLPAEIVNGATLGLSLLEILKSAERTVVVDAVDMGRPPGTLVRFSAEELLTLPESRNFSLHEIGLLEVLKIGQSLNEDFKNVIIIGVQPRDLTYGEELSPEVEARIPDVIELIKKEVG
ncbi:MAG: HyaD/HybD family hydrogenase maturation endopeptidase [Candidatus Margulisiibacteriota bacterium]